MKKIRIIIVEDDEDFNLAVKGSLAYKYDTSSAFSGEELLEKLPEIKPHIIVLDLGLPGISGQDCIPKIKEFDSNIYILVVSGISDEKEIQKAMKLGGNDLLTKPIRLEDLRFRISRAIHELGLDEK